MNLEGLWRREKVKLPVRSFRNVVFRILGLELDSVFEEMEKGEDNEGLTEIADESIGMFAGADEKRPQRRGRKGWS